MSSEALQLLGYWWKEILSVALLLPLLWYLLKNFTKVNEKWFIAIVEWLKEHDKTSKELFKLLISSVWRIKIDNEKLLEITKKYVLSASFEKLDYIKQRLEKNNLKKRKDLIEKQLRAELIRISNESYITPLNHFNTPVWPLWDYVKNNFDFDNFIQEVYDVIFRNEEKEDIPRKLQDITTVMKVYQNTLYDKLKEEFNK